MAPTTVSRKPSKQRKSYFQAPLHIRRKLMTAPLARELKEKLGLKRLPVRRGDKVRVVRGSFAGIEGKVTRVDLRKLRIYVEGVTRQRSDGTPVHVPIHPSKVVIVELDLSDRKRRESIEVRKGAREQRQPHKALAEVKQSGEQG